MLERNDPLIPVIGEVTDIRIDTPDVKTFRVVTPDGKKPFEHTPGQCAMLSIPGVGEAMFSITSSPTNEEFMEFSIKKCGCVTQWLHSMDGGQQITIRGPYGRPFPVDTDFAVLTGKLSGIGTLKAQGVEKIAFVTKDATSAFRLADLLEKGAAGETYKLTHDGKTAAFTAGGQQTDISDILVKA